MRRTVVFHLVLWATVAGTATAAPAAARHRRATAEAAADPCAGLGRSDLRACRADQAKAGKAGRGRAAEEDPCAGLARAGLRACRADQDRAAKPERVREAEAVRGDPCAGLSRRSRAACERDAEAVERSEARRASRRATPSPEPARSAQTAAQTAARREVSPDDLVGGVETGAAAPAAPALRGSIGGVAVPFARPARAGRRPTRLHEVILEDGQTLADLAARTGVSVDDLARLNGVASIEDVPTGMRVKVPGAVAAPQTAAVRLPSLPAAAGPPPVFASAPPPTAPPPAASPRSSREDRRALASAGPGPRPYASLGPEGSRSAEPAPAVVGRHGRTQADALAAYAVASARAPHLADTESTRHDRFVWPLRSEVVSGFGDHGPGRRNDGLDLAARPGDAVRAAAGGEVVYAGKEIAAMGGNLVLLKHADGWVTAYSHLGHVTVAMRQTVEQGQEIAEAPDTAGASVHFEVRQPSAAGAKPVDPASVLPSRSGGETGRGL